MKATEYNKSRIMRNAWKIKRRNASVSFSECLSLAWAREKLNVAESRRNNVRKPKRVERSISPMMANSLVNFYASSAYCGD